MTEEQNRILDGLRSDDRLVTFFNRKDIVEIVALYIMSRSPFRASILPEGRIIRRSF